MSLTLQDLLRADELFAATPELRTDLEPDTTSEVDRFQYPGEDRSEYLPPKLALASIRYITSNRASFSGVEQLAVTSPGDLEPSVVEEVTDGLNMRLRQLHDVADWSGVLI